MNSNQYVEDATIQGRKEEIEIKVGRIINLLKAERLDALYLTRQPNFAWITAGASNTVTMCTEAGVASVLVTREGARYLITDRVEARRMIEEQHLEELGFEVLSQEWFEDKNTELVTGVAGSMDRVGADIPFGEARMIQDRISPLRYSLTHNEVCRYQYLGAHMSTALEKYLTTVKPGMSEYEIAGGVAGALWPEQIDQVLYLVAADERIKRYRHAIPTTNTLKKSLMVSCKRQV